MVSLLACANAPNAGRLTILTYNVFGLPRENGAENIAQMGEHLNRYDFVLIQEDFIYHDLLERGDHHPFRSIPGAVLPDRAVNDGLNIFSVLPFNTDFGVQRIPWDDCSGIDCLSSKGIAVVRIAVHPNATIDVYNLHLRSGSEELDFEVRALQIDQLIGVVKTLSPSHAVIVAGDTNLTPGLRSPSGSISDSELFQQLLDRLELVDSCQQIFACASTDPRRIDRVMVRSSSSVIIDIVDWFIDERFVDRAGNPLSDHDAVGTTIQWQVTGERG